jgi:hypothetical protein
MQLITRAAKLLRHYLTMAVRRRMPPNRARTFPYSIQYIRCRRDASCVQWQRRMDFKARRTPYGKAAWVFPSGKRHGAALVIVAKEWKPAVCPVCRNPFVAVSQCNEASLFRKGPRQPQAG